MDLPFEFPPVVPRQPSDITELNFETEGWNISDPSLVLKSLVQRLSDNGTLVAVVPHPFKDSGFWEKTPTEQGYAFGRFVVSNYFYEGVITKTREDGQGNVVIPEVRSHKRNLGTYFQLFVDAGFIVESIIEPTISANNDATDASISKVSRVPYFLVIVCSKRDRSSQQTSK